MLIRVRFAKDLPRSMEQGGKIGAGSGKAEAGFAFGKGLLDASA